MPKMSQRQYAVHRGLSRAAVQKAISTGRISTLPDGMIDSDRADQAWEQNTVTPAGDGPKLTRARLMLTLRKAAIADVQYKQLIGEFLPKAEIQVATFNSFRQIRDRMLGIPDRVAGMVAAETDPRKCYTILVDEIRTALQQFAESAEKGVPNEAK
jgi:hypothetical protein